ncbi:MAG: hypothetical protein BAJALOKI2v1_490009 [Promethearchaeota archaeon]|nr:MAG: hypothetical protein BAJALOKI2v1_490009 [Candidatus Lokiarchaeota archaeon]
MVSPYYIIISEFYILNLSSCLLVVYQIDYKKITINRKISMPPIYNQKNKENAILFLQENIKSL